MCAILPLISDSFEYFTTPTPYPKLIHRDATTHAFILLKAVLISEIYKEIKMIDLESVEWIFEDHLGI